MMKHKIIISAVVGILVVIVLLVLAWFFAPKLLGKHEVIVFVPYEVTDETNNSWGAPAGITVKIDVPQGDQALVDTASVILSMSRLWRSSWDSPSARRYSA